MATLLKTKKVYFGGKELVLRLDGKTIVQIENKLNKNLLSLFIDNGKMTFPKTGEMLLILHAANTGHGIKEADMYDLLDIYLGDGNSTTDLMTTIQELLEESGFFGKTEKENENLDGGLVTLEEPEADLEEHSSLLE
ncbi:DUF6096 family protein [Carnobacterium antarcticum]|uniref:DUF6096 family protein n=1 Tax=Carnobacterium antarcticum TaxID=2126436 RepID=A0ABW4NNC8_9LACT|nr:DUF6096 family protein [Carnobacterium sp. CP1]ALV20763.1 hypothetical protein NY10_138 [Carnobacterium sp. CP1]